MKAMLFAAGLGTRLRPYTNDRPKALVEIEGQTLLGINLRRLKSFGVEEVVVNVHHFADLVEAHLQANGNYGLNIHVSDERGLLLDTGGGLAQARQWLGDAPFLVHNVDILTDLNLADLYEFHINRCALTTLATRQRETSRYLEFDTNARLAGWRNVRTGERRISRLVDPVQLFAYSGISVIDPRLFDYFPAQARVFSIIDVWLEAAKNEILLAYPHDDSRWLDVGKPPALAQAATAFADWLV
ncbi:MAG: sugar phosphate nucleotidyltransferase [Bacteroidota bacterium]